MVCLRGARTHLVHVARFTQAEEEACGSSGKCDLALLERSSSYARCIGSGEKAEGASSICSSLNSLVRDKKEQGIKLTAVEAHLRNNLRSLKRNYFGPTLLFVLCDLVQAFLRPLPILIVLTLLTASTRSSLAWFPGTTGDETEDLEIGRIYQESLAEAESKDNEAIAEAFAGAKRERVVLQLAALEGDFPSSLPLLSPFQPKKPVSSKGIIGFISRIISEYYPSISDAEKMARDIVITSHEEGVDPLLITSIVAAESSFNAHARSVVGALGLMQLRPSTALDVVKRKGVVHPYFRLTDPSINLRLGITYLKELEERFAGNRYIALAAYNWGPTNVSKAKTERKAIPRSVRKYSAGILETTLKWHRHFQQVTKREQTGQARG